MAEKNRRLPRVPKKKARIYFSLEKESRSSIQWKISEFSKIYTQILKYFSRHTRSVEIRLVGSQTMKKMNTQFRGKRKTTDVLSFPAANPKQKLGSIAIDLKTASKQAQFYHHSLKQEVFELFIHGVLHLIGYDHEQKQDAAKMKKAEEKMLLWLKKLRLGH